MVRQSYQGPCIKHKLYKDNLIINLSKDVKPKRWTPSLDPPSFTRNIFSLIKYY